MRALRCAFGLGQAALVVVVACSGSGSSGTDAGATDQTGQTCKAPSDCYSAVTAADAGAIKGTITCLTQVTNGYCTHTCATDADCCAVPGECQHGFKQVCSPFESTGQTMCFLSCEASDIAAAENQGLLADAGADTATAYCQKYASAAFGCRSTGGGRANRQVCLP